MRFLGCGDIPCQPEEQCQHEQPPNTVGTSKELSFLHSLYDLQNCVKDQHKEILKQFKGKICFGVLAFGKCSFFFFLESWTDYTPTSL